MVIGLNKLLDRVKMGELIKHLSQRELNNPEGAGFDLSVGEVYRIISSGFLGLNERYTSKVELMGKYNKKSSKTIQLLPEEYYLIKTVEEISLDDDMLGIFHPRSTLFRSGVILQTGVQPPGYAGSPSFGLQVVGKYPFNLELGARIAHINILRIEGTSSTYRGQWQGGRVAANEPEKQV